MKVPCIVRTGLNGAILLSKFDISTGIVSDVPESILKCELPAGVKQFFSRVTADIAPTGQSLYDLKKYILQNPYCYLVFVDYGNHLYVCEDRQVSVISTKSIDSSIYAWEQTPNIFNVQQLAVGFWRQPIVLYDVPPVDYQKLNVFMAGRLGIVYWDGKRFTTMKVACDGNPKYQNIDYINFARQDDEDIIGVVTCDGKETYLRRV